MPDLNDYETIFGAADTEDPETLPDAEEETETGEESPEAKTGEKTEEDAPEDGKESEEEPEKEGNPGELTAEERHRNAALRREREDRVRQETEQTKIDAIYSDLFSGQVNPFTGNPIRTQEEYNAYRQQTARSQQEAELQEAGVSPDTIRALVNEAVAPIQQQAALARAQAVQAQAQQEIQAALRNIHAEMPEISTLDDIAALPTAGRFNDLVRQGVGMEDAFYLANRKGLEKNKLRSARQAALNQAAGKGHLAPSGTAAGDPIAVPVGLAESFREINPGISDAEMLKQYQSYLKSIRD